MQPDAEQVTQRVEQMARTFEEWGFPRMPSRVLVTMMSAEADGMTALDLAERLDVTAPAISHAVRYLVQLGLLERTPVPGSRRDLYRIADDAWYISSTVKGGVYKVIGDQAAGLAEALGGKDSPAGTRLAEMAEFYAFVQSELDGLLERWQDRKAGR